MERKSICIDGKKYGGFTGHQTVIQYIRSMIFSCHYTDIIQFISDKKEVLDVLGIQVA